jgi:Fe2+ or Zn2+ uptake regulation protein
MKIHYYTEDILKICENNHLTVDDIYEKISSKYKDAGKSSIYRNVEELVKK